MVKIGDSTVLAYIIIFLESRTILLLKCGQELIFIYQTIFSYYNYWLISNSKAIDYSLRGRIGKVVASHANVARSIPGWADILPRFILCTRRSGGTAHEGGDCDQSIGSTVSDAIVHSWLGSTATMSYHWDTSVDYCKWLIIDPTFCRSRFSTGWFLAIEDFTFLQTYSELDYLLTRPIKSPATRVLTQ